MMVDSIPYLVCGKTASHWLAFEEFHLSAASYCEAHFEERMNIHRGLLELEANGAITPPLTNIREVSMQEAVVLEIMQL